MSVVFSGYSGFFLVGGGGLVVDKVKVWFKFMVFNATFNNISVISFRSVLLVKETGVPGENHRHVASH
jgi:hypothetical protein